MVTSRPCHVPQIAHFQLVANELMIHRRVDAKVPFIIKSDLDAHGTVEGAGPHLSFLKLQLGNRLSTCPQSMLPHYWQCTFQVHLLGPCISSVPVCIVNCSDLALTLSLRRYCGPICIIKVLWQADADLANPFDCLVHISEFVGQTCNAVYVDVAGSDWLACSRRVTPGHQAREHAAH